MEFFSRSTRSKFLALVALICAAPTLVGAPVMAQNEPSQADADQVETASLAPVQLSQPDAGPDTNFGQEVAIGDGLIAVAGDSTYVYELDGGGWVGSKLTDHTGPMAIDAGRVLIGDVGDGVYLYERDGDSWAETLVTQGVVGPVAFHRGNPVVVGQSGVLYMFEALVGGGWSPHRLGAGFRSVTATNDRIVVGKFAATDQNTAGLVTIFDADDAGDFVISALFPSDGSSTDGFGYSVSLDGDRLAVGSTSGKAYVFEYDEVRGWVERSLPVPRAAFGPSGTAFGLDVSISGAQVAIGSPNGEYTGIPGARPATYVFEPNGLGNWVMEDDLGTPGGSQGFGFSVGIDGPVVVAGSPASADGKGRAFVFGPLPMESTAEVSHVVSCLADNGRVDTNIVNPTNAGASYRVEFQGLTDRSRTVDGLDWWRSPVTGRSDGSYQIIVKRDGAVVSDQTVTVSCDTSPPVVSSDEVQVMSACRGGAGYVLFQMVNSGPEDKPYVVEFAGVPNRSTTAAGFGATVRATTGRQDGTYGVTVRSGTSVVDAFAVTVDCVADEEPQG